MSCGLTTPKGFLELRVIVLRRLRSALAPLLMFAAAVLAGPSTVPAEPRQLVADARFIAESQPRLVDRALDAVKPATAGRGEIYFVGFAGYGPQAVFKREVEAVRELFDGRFGTAGRSVALINHASTASEVPLATPKNLERVLLRLGALMDREDGVLFLFLTSHGQRNRFAVEMPGFDIAQITPKDLKSVLDRSGIRNRVVVISACHSGSFVPALADANTLVIAAARADRTSFGCDDRRQWTYFGDAYFNRALREDKSFVRAFGEAKRLIRQWEKQEGLRPSLPQIAGGQALQGRLDAIAAPDARR